MERLIDLCMLPEEKLKRCIYTTSLILGSSEKDIEDVLIGMIPKDITIKVYSDKSFVVRIDERSEILKQGIVSLGGTFNSRLKGGPGYIFPLTKIREVRDYIMLFPDNIKKFKPVKKSYTNRWIFEDVTQSFPFSDQSGRTYTGAYYKKIIPIPKEEKYIDQYIKLLLSFDSNTVYWPSHAFLIVERAFKDGERDSTPSSVLVESFMGKDFKKEIFWIEGDSVLVENKINELYEKYPPNPYGSYHHIRLIEDNRCQAYFFRGSSE